MKIMSRGKSLQSAVGFFGQIARELRRLNSARLGNERLSQIPASERVRAVKDALAAHHQASARCC
jgi:hypothetical protein